MRCTTTRSGRIERCSCVHRARTHLSPNWLTVGSDVNRSSAGSSTSTNEPRPETGQGLRSRPATRPRPPEDPELESRVGDTLSYVTETRGAAPHDDGVDT